MKCYEIYEEAGVGSKIVAKTAPSHTPWYSMIPALVDKCHDFIQQVKPEMPKLGK